MSNWVIHCSATYLILIYIILKTFLLRESSIHADETTVQILHEPGRSAQKKSYEWVYRTGVHSKHNIVIFEYKETRERKHPEKFLKDYKGYIHCDGYESYHSLHDDIIIVGCWNHAREYWEKLLKTIPRDDQKGSDAEKGVAYINYLFKLERKFADLSPEERYEKRLEKSKPIAEAFFAWVKTLNPLPKSLLGKAVTYALLQREYLENVFLDGRLELSNNRCLFLQINYSEQFRECVYDKGQGLSS